MRLQPKYNVWLDGLGLIIDPLSYRVSPSPLMGSKFATGRAGYSGLDFWQVNGQTDFTHGINQKYMVDPSAVWQSLGLDFSKPGEFTLERDTETYSGFPSSNGKVISSYRKSDRLYLGTDAGYIMNTPDGITWYSYKTDQEKVTCFYELEDTLFAACGEGYVLRYRPTYGDWVSSGYGVKQTGQLYWPTAFVPEDSEFKPIYGSRRCAQTFKVPESSNKFDTLELYMKKNGAPPYDLTIRFWKDDAGIPDYAHGELGTITVSASTVSTEKEWKSLSLPSNMNLLSGLTYWFTLETPGGSYSASYWVYYSYGQRAALATGELHDRTGEIYDPPASEAATDYSIYTLNQISQKFYVNDTGDYYACKIKAKIIGVPAEGLTVEIVKDVSGNPTGEVISSFLVNVNDANTQFNWIEKTASVGGKLLKDELYWIRLSSPGSADISNCWIVNTWISPTYPRGIPKSSIDGGSSWIVTGRYVAFSITGEVEYESDAEKDFLFRLKRTSNVGLYYTMVDSDYAFGWFNDGVRKSVDGVNWLPEPPDPLWVLPISEGAPLNAISIPRGFLCGSKTGLWIFIGGSAGISLWSFPDYSSSNNFRGMGKWGSYAIFSVEGIGLYFTDGSQVFPTNLVSIGEAFPVKYCRGIHVSGWDAYALVSTDGTTWYLARCNMTYSKVPQYWWPVKQLSVEPQYISGYGSDRLFVHYANETTQLYKPKTGPYVSEGWMITSMVDENMVKVLKNYNSISAIMSQFPAGATCKLGIRHTFDSSFVDKTFTSDGTSTTTNFERIYRLYNPTVSSRHQVKVTVTPNAGRTISTVVNDVMWKYMLEKPSEDVLSKLTFGFTVIAHDGLETMRGDADALPGEKFRTRQDIISALRTIASKKQALNFIGADNVSTIGLEIRYLGASTSCLMTIDRTNYLITTSCSTVPTDNLSYSYEGKTLDQVVTGLNGLTYSVSVHPDETGRTAEDLEPISGIEIKCDANGQPYEAMVGTDVHAVILNPQAPSQQKLSIDGRGEDKISVSLREV